MKHTLTRKNVTVEISLGDYFSITGTKYVEGKPRTKRNIERSGCIHDEIVKAFPELKKFIRWHLVDITGVPIHYIANTVYLAGNRDYNGKLKGEPSRFEDFIRFGNSPISHALSKEMREFIESGREPEIVEVSHRESESYGQFLSKYTFRGLEETWYKCPFDNERAAREYALAIQVGYTIESVPTAFGQGKERELDAARRSALWPEATDEQLSVEPNELRASLEARLPALQAEFKAAMKELESVIAKIEKETV